jgi:hypothetical protein
MNPMDETPISLMPRWYERLWGWINSLLGSVFQLTVIIAAVTFLQQLEPVIDRSIDHETKVLTVASTGFVPMTVRVYAIRFEINYLIDAANHIALNAQEPIAGISTRGFVLEGTTWWRPLAVDLKRSNGLTFTTWPSELSRQAGLYCLAVEARNPLSNRSVIEPILTPEMMFSASVFGPMSRKSGMGGGYPKDLLAVEQQVKSDCRALYDKVRGG